MIRKLTHLTRVLPPGPSLTRFGLERMHQQCVTLPSSLRAKARQIGHGNLSQGVRRALRAYCEERLGRIPGA